MQQLPTGGILLDAFPFDSNPNNITTVNGYLRGDRSVDAWTMRSAFRQFFSSGVFGTPANAFQLGKGESGLSVTVQPGMCVIEGAMGGVESRNGEITLQLDSGPAAGNVCYGVFLRYDDNADTRGIALVSRKGEAGASPQPPAPDTSSANVHELRLGYVTVPNGASGLENATVTNEKGLDVCPYAAPFEKIDLSDVVSDMRASGAEALQKLLDYFETYRDVIDAALSDEEATYLQQQINQLAQQISEVDLSEAVDNATIEYTNNPPDEIETKLRVKDGGITGEKIADYAIDSNKLTAELQIQLDVVDTSDWGFEQYYGFVGSLSGDYQNDFVAQMDMSVVNSWSQQQKIQFVQELEDNAQKTFMSKIDLASISWAELQAVSDACSPTGRSGMLGRSKSATFNGSPRDFMAVSVDHYGDVIGLVFMYRNSSTNNAVQGRKYYGGTNQKIWEESSLFSYTNSTFVNALGDDLKSIIKECPIPSHGYQTASVRPAARTVSAKAWTPSREELAGPQTTSTFLAEGTQFDWFAMGNGTGVNTGHWTRTSAARSDDGQNSDNYVFQNSNTSGGFTFNTAPGSKSYATPVFICV